MAERRGARFTGKLAAKYGADRKLRLLEDAGYLPELGDCLVCGKAIVQGHHRYAPALGGVVCDTCTVPLGQVLPLSVDGLKVLRHFAREGFASAVRLRLSAEQSDELETVLGAALHYVLEREVSSASFVEHLRRLRRRASAG